MPTTNAPQPRLTRVCTEATTDADHAGCSGGFCECDCHPPAPPVPLHGARPGRFGRAPESALEEMRRLRDERRARTEDGR